MIVEKLVVASPIITASQYDNGSYFQEEFDSIPTLEEIESFCGICLVTRWENEQNGHNIMVRDNDYFILRNNGLYEDEVSQNEAYNYLINS